MPTSQSMGEPLSEHEKSPQLSPPTAAAAPALMSTIPQPITSDLPSPNPLSKSKKSTVIIQNPKDQFDQLDSCVKKTDSVSTGTHSSAAAVPKFKSSTFSFELTAQEAYAVETMRARKKYALLGTKETISLEVTHDEAFGLEVSRLKRKYTLNDHYSANRCFDEHS
jgi:hypothetical protein